MGARPASQADLLCNPNNPTGLYLTEKEVCPLLEACVEAGGLLVVDEAYINFVESAWASVALLKSGHLVLLHSMTKDYALAGLRLGYLLVPAEVIEVLSKVQPPWSVNAVAQETGVAALASEGHYRDAWRKLRGLTQVLRRSLLELGLEAFPTDANFLLIRIGDVARAREELWAHHILVRDCASFELPAYIRVGARLEEDNRRLVSCLKRFLESAFLWAN